MFLKLTVHGGPLDGLESDVCQLPVTLGREGETALNLQDRWASRHHCELFAHEGQLMVRDLASKHGTYVNGQRIEQSTLASGDRLMVGLTQLVVSQLSLAPSDRPSNGGQLAVI